MTQDTETQKEFDKLTASQDVSLQVQQVKIQANTLTAAFVQDSTLAEAISPGHHERVRGVISQMTQKP